MDQIRSAASRIAETFKPERIVLFGSYAYGKPTGDSDVDLMVVMRGRGRPQEREFKIRQSLQVPFAVDILVRSPEEIRKRISQDDFFLQEKGMTLYEAPDARMGFQGRR